MTGVLFVCTGNICRSPTAEAVFTDMLRSRGLEGRIFADSCGISGHHVGEPPDPRSRAAALRRGIDMSALRARALQPGDGLRFDLLLAMDSGHLRHLRNHPAPGFADRARLFLEPVAQRFGRTEVPDPYYDREGRGFDLVLDLVEAASAAWLDRLTTGDVR